MVPLNVDPPTAVLNDDDTVVKRCKLIVVSDANDSANSPLLDHTDSIPHLDLLAIGISVDDFDIDQLKAQGANAIFVGSGNARDVLARLVEGIPSIEWIHTRSAGIDHVTSSQLSSVYSSRRIQMTNAKGLFSSTLAEYTLMACAYFAKDLVRIRRQQAQKQWTKFPIRELRGTTLGVVGCGDIGRACARLARAYGMRIVGLKRRRPAAGGDATADEEDPLVDTMYYMQEDDHALCKVFAESDFVVCAAPLTEDTRNMIDKRAFDCAKPNAVFINVGRGQIVDEVALVEALESGKLCGAGLDVTATEPLPQDSKLWSLDNVLLSPHNMDMTETFMQESTEWFVTQNVPLFVRGLALENKVDPTAGY